MLPDDESTPIDTRIETDYLPFLHHAAGVALLLARSAKPTRRDGSAGRPPNLPVG